MVELKLESAKKVYLKGTHRTRKPEDTLRWIEPKMKTVGITRISNITGLDRVGIPIFSAIRPTAAEGAISVYSGKGLTDTLAKISAIMEGVERYSAEFRGSESILKGSYLELSKKFNVLNPEELILPEKRAFGEDLVLRWVCGYDLLNNEEILVPVSAVFHPYSPKGDFHLFRTNTNGLASGNTIEEAIFHGLMEVIERDGWSIAEFCRNGGETIEVDGAVKELSEMFKRVSIKLILRDITTDIKIPVVAAISDDLMLKDPALLTMGFGAHPDPKIAAMRAILEVAQSRLVQIQGAREDTVKAEFMRRIGYERIKRLNKHWFAEGEESKKLESLPKYFNEDILDDIKMTLKILKSRGLERVIVVNLEKEEVGVPTVRVIVPGLEVYGMDPTRVGERALSFLRK